MVSAPPTLDEFDLKILDQVQSEGRITNAELATRVGLSESPCFRRVRAMEESGLIAGYHAHLDASHLGLKIIAFIEVKVARHSGDAATRLRALFQSDPHIVGCYMMTGGYDFLLKVVANDLESYKTYTVEKLLSSSDIQDIRTSIVLDLVKDTSSLPLARPVQQAKAKPKRPKQR